MREADLGGWNAGSVHPGADELADGLVDGEQGPHLLGDTLGVLDAQYGLAFAHVGLVMADHCFAPPPHRVGAGQIQSRISGHVEQVGDQAEHLGGGLFGVLTVRAGVHGVLDDPHRDGCPSAVRAGFNWAR